MATLRHQAQHSSKHQHGTILNTMAPAASASSGSGAWRPKKLTATERRTKRGRTSEPGVEEVDMEGKEDKDKQQEGDKDKVVKSMGKTASSAPSGDGGRPSRRGGRRSRHAKS